jgi:8-amino-7-oxononanoate synthase
MPYSELQKELHERATLGLLRRRCTLESPQAPHIVVEGKRYVSFSSNDYLGLANHPELVAALQQGALHYGVGAGAAHLVCGHSKPHHQLELELAAFVEKPAALLFSSGYQANLGVVQALVGKHDTIFADKLNHASLNDAMLLSRATVKRYRHCDMAQLATLLEQSPNGRKLVISDAVFSMDGDLAPLPELLTLCVQHDAWLLIDDAHGFGVLGDQGRGSMFGIHSKRIIYMATLGKAAGVSGAFVAAEQAVIDTLINHARTYIYTTAMPPALAHATLHSLKLINAGDALRLQLHTRIAQLKRCLTDLKYPLLSSDTAIQPLLVGANQETLLLCEALKKRGLWVAAIRPPTVPKGTARLRITLSAAHSAEDVTLLSEALHELIC